MTKYHNTNDLAGQELDKAKRSANSQERRILQFFRKNPTRAFSPEDVQIYCQLVNRPLTSTRRALSNLASDGFLRKTNSMKIGKYGSPIHLWVLQENQGEQVGLF